MNLLEATIILVLLIVTAFSTVDYYIRGRPGKCLYYTLIILAPTLAFIWRKISPSSLLLASLCLMWFAYLHLTYAVDQGRIRLRRYYVVFFIYLAILMTFRNLIQNAKPADAIFAGILIIHAVSFWTFSDYPSGFLRPFKASLTIQAILWAILLCLAARGSLYTVDGYSISWRLLQDGALNMHALDNFCEGLLLGYSFGILMTSLYLFWGFLYHGFIPGEHKRTFIRSYMLILILSCICPIPPLRQAVETVPGVGKYISSAPLALLLMVASIFEVLRHVVKHKTYK